MSELYDIAYKVNLTGCELVKHGNRPKSDYIDFYEGRMEHKLSMNNMFDELYNLAISNEILETYTENLSRSDLSFIRVKSFLGEHVERNQAQKLVQSLVKNKLAAAAAINDDLGLQIVGDVPNEINDCLEETLKDGHSNIRLIFFRVEPHYNITFDSGGHTYLHHSYIRKLKKLCLDCDHFWKR